MNLGSYLYMRFISLIGQFFGGMVVIFVLARNFPYNASSVILWGLLYSRIPRDEAIEIVNAQRETWGVNEPLLIQFFNYWATFFSTGSLGNSWFGPSVNALISNIYFPIIVSFVILILIAPITMYTGVLSAKKQQSAFDFNVKLMSSIIYGVPYYIFGVMFVLILEIQEITISGSSKFWVYTIDLILILVLVFSSYQYRVIRKDFIEELSKTYIRTAKAKGLNERQILYKHALKNKIPSILISYGGLYTLIFSSVLVMEVVLSINYGIGNLLVSMTLGGDWGTLIGVSTIILLLVNIVNYFTDISVKFFNTPFEIYRG